MAGGGAAAGAPKKEGKEGKGGGGDAAKDKAGKDKKKATPTFGKQKKKRSAGLEETLTELVDEVRDSVQSSARAATDLMYAKGTASYRLSIGCALIFVSFSYVAQFYAYSHQFAERSSQPQIMFQAQLNNGQQVIVDDYREA